MYSILSVLGPYVQRSGKLCVPESLLFLVGFLDSGTSQQICRSREGYLRNCSGTKFRFLGLAPLNLALDFLCCSSKSRSISNENQHLTALESKGRQPRKETTSKPQPATLPPPATRSWPVPLPQPHRTDAEPAKGNLRLRTQLWV